MQPRPYYDVNPHAYLFGKSDETPEEKIRQWVLFELLSTYGVAINNIEVERQVKVGTRIHRADIVIQRESAPYVVIECKRWDDGKRSQGMQQAISYADANTMKARFAVYTNGDAWEVKRKMGAEWVDIPDLPKRVDGDHEIGLEELVRSLDEFKPAFYWLNQTVPAASARAYFSCLQILFNGTTYPLNHLDHDLCVGTDNLLRVIWANGDHHDDYLHGKMVAACEHFSAFIERRLDQEGEEIHHVDTLCDLTVSYKMRFEWLVRDAREIQGDEVYLIRFIATLLQYLFDQIRIQQQNAYFPDVPPVLTKAFQDLVEYLFQIHIGVRFPDPVLEQSCTDLRQVCSSAWEEFEKQTIKPSGGVFFSGILCWIRSWFANTDTPEG